MSDVLNYVAACAAIVLGVVLFREAAGVFAEIGAGWSLGATLSDYARRDPRFGIALVCFIWFACGIFTFHIIERTGVLR